MLGGSEATHHHASMSRIGRVAKVEMTTPMALICKALFPIISTFETPPSHGHAVFTLLQPAINGANPVALLQSPYQHELSKCSVERQL